MLVFSFILGALGLRSPGYGLKDDTTDPRWTSCDLAPSTGDADAPACAGRGHLQLGCPRLRAPGLDGRVVFFRALVSATSVKRMQLANWGAQRVCLCVWHISMHIYTRECVYVCMYIYIYMCVHVFILDMHIRVYTCIYRIVFCILYSACMHACMHACLYMYPCDWCFYVINVCVYVCMYVCMHACMYVCMYACNVSTYDVRNNVLMDVSM